MNQFLIATHSTLAEGLANAIHFFNNDAANIHYINAYVEDNEFEKALRAKLAARQGVPAYVIFSDATLQDMCARLPSDKEEMLEVSGVGDAKFARYGEAFLKEIAAFIDANGIPF